MNLIKKISKYLVNILSIINVLLIKLEPIWDIPYVDKIIDTIAVVTAVIGTYLLGSKTINSVLNEEVKTDLVEDELSNITIYDNENTILDDINE